MIKEYKNNKKIFNEYFRSLIINMIPFFSIFYIFAAYLLIRIFNSIKVISISKIIILTSIIFIILTIVILGAVFLGFFNIKILYNNFNIKIDENEIMLNDKTRINKNDLKKIIQKNDKSFFIKINYFRSFNISKYIDNFEELKIDLINIHDIINENEYKYKILFKFKIEYILNIILVIFSIIYFYFINSFLDNVFK